MEGLFSLGNRCGYPNLPFGGVDLSVLAFLSSKETSAKIKYLKETVLIEDKKPTKIILRFVASFDENEYGALLKANNPVIVVKMPSSMSIIENSVEITQYKLIYSDLVKDSFKPKDYGYLSPENADIAKRYLDALKKFEEIGEKWIGLYWKPRDDTDDHRFYAPLYPLLKQVTERDIVIELPAEKPPTINGKCNLGLMLNFFTNDIPLKKGFILETRIDIQNTKGTDCKSLPEKRIIGIENGELWVLYPENALVSLVHPEQDKMFLGVKEDEKVIQEYSKKLYGVRRWLRYKPKIASVSLKWDIDRHIKNWEFNTLTFFSQALLVDVFWDSIRDSILDEVRFILSRELELLKKRVLERDPQSQRTLTGLAKIQLKKGECYLLEAEEATKGYEILMKYIGDHNTEGLCMIRGSPRPLLKKIESGKIKIVNIDTTGSPGSISPLDDQAIVAKVKKFLERKKGSIVFFDMLDYLYYSSDFNYLMNLLMRVSDIGKTYGGVLIVVANPIVFEWRISVLEKEFELIDSS